MQAELKQKIEDKPRALNRAMDELHNDQGSRVNVAESVLELINVVWPNPAQGGHDSTNFRQVMRYVSNLLRSGDEDQLLSSRSIPSPTYKSVDMPSPAYPPFMERGGAEHTTARAKSPLDRVDDFYGNMLIDNLNLTSQSFQSQGFGTLMAMADNMENSNLDQLTPEDDLSLLSQLTPQLEVSMSMDLQPYTSPEFWEAWLAELVPMACPDSPAGLGAPIANLSNEISQSWHGPFPVTPNLHDHLNKREVSAGLSDSGDPISTKTAANVNDIATGLKDNNSEPEMIEQISRLDSFRAA
ncbi:hypothetical protein ASPFODRAFT_85901 [Aspergillus luchuensis CBS 106.47]|uniref:Uncharacterized protein n=1 Tax=Aspergillus luchuensis (strain CBS 106.47) TaxID=1137211 RepID=A0A1M3T132_ASPLC|nr:hypothetical protein ASPFODRAFT_85901 [Aspergillus luchuensis CBS 106.47]